VGDGGAGHLRLLQQTTSDLWPLKTKRAHEVIDALLRGEGVYSAEQKDEKEGGGGRGEALVVE
jgi:hypothetical protein